MARIYAHLPGDLYLALALHAGDQTASQRRLAAVLGLRLPSLTGLEHLETQRSGFWRAIRYHQTEGHYPGLEVVQAGAGSFGEQLGGWTQACPFVFVAAHTGDMFPPG